MPKHVLVALPLSDAQRSALQASVPEYEFTFAKTETVTLAQVLEADIIMGNVPVELICQNHHLEWFQSNFAGPDTYLVPGVLPEQCLVTNATGAYGLAISEWMLGLWLVIYALSDFLIMILSWLVKQSLRAFLFQEVQL